MKLLRVREDRAIVRSAAAAAMATLSTCELRVRFEPQCRHETIDLRARSECREAFEYFPNVVCCSMHTTAGYLSYARARRFGRNPVQLNGYLSRFRAAFPWDGDYFHNRMDLRSDLSQSDRIGEPLNADAHLSFMMAGLQCCVKYRTELGEPVHWIELDGVSGRRRRSREARVVGYNVENVVARLRLSVATPERAIGVVNLKTVGLYEILAERIAALGITLGRVRVGLAPEERDAFLTINEDEPLLIEKDLTTAVRRELGQGGSGRREPLAATNRSFVALVSDSNSPGRGQIVEGPYQSPLLVQWNAPSSGCRILEIALTRLR